MDSRNQRTYTTALVRNFISLKRLSVSVQVVLLIPWSQKIVSDLVQCRACLPWGIVVLQSRDVMHTTPPTTGVWGQVWL